MEKHINNWYTLATEQIKVKTSNSKDEIDQLFESVYSSENISNLLSVIQKIIAIIPKSEAAEETIK